MASPAVVRRKVQIAAAADLDPLDPEDVESLLTRVEWADAKAAEFRASAAKKHKAVGEFSAIGPLSKELIEAFVKYLLARTVAQVRYHTIGDFIDGCIECTNYENYEDMRRALGRLLENMGIATVRQLGEHPTVDTETKREEVGKMLSHKGRFAAQCKSKEWLSEGEVSLLFPAMKSVTNGWAEAVECTLRSDENLAQCRRLLGAQRSRPRRFSAERRSGRPRPTCAGR